MPNLTDLKEELTEVTTLKYISAAFAEASAAKIGKIRQAFEHNTRYFDEISSLYHIVKVSLGVQKKLATKAGHSPTNQTSSPTTVAIATTSNHRFFGPLNINTMTEFATATEKMTLSQRLVIGQTGADYLSLTGYSRKYELVLFNKDYPTDAEMRALLTRLAGFEKVLLFYPRFATMLRQTVAMVDITQTPAPAEIDAQKLIRYLFEPELSLILAFFERQVRTLLFTRAMLEAELSRTAARLMSMSAAEEKADEMIGQTRVRIARLRSSIANLQLLETFSGRSKWKRN